jgi:short-subunit dehydrogenase
MVELLSWCTFFALPLWVRVLDPLGVACVRGMAWSARIMGSDPITVNAINNMSSTLPVVLLVFMFIMFFRIVFPRAIPIQRGEWALVTGASSGIGLEIARELARHRCRVVLLARSRSALDALKEHLVKEHQADVHVLVCDLSLSSSTRVVFDEINKLTDGYGLDILVNNAGFATTQEFIDTDLRRQEEMMQLNMVSSTVLTRLFLPQMVSRGRGRIMNIASIVGFLPVPSWSVYSATKAFLLTFSDALHFELRRTGVTVTCCAPGPTDSNFFQVGGCESSVTRRCCVVHRASYVAQQAVHAMIRGERMMIPGINYVLTRGPKFVPRFVSLLVGRTFMHNLA